MVIDRSTKLVCLRNRRKELKKQYDTIEERYILVNSQLNEIKTEYLVINDIIEFLEGKNAHDKYKQKMEAKKCE